jgi:hypothetical protein
MRFFPQPKITPAIKLIAIVCLVLGSVGVLTALIGWNNEFAAGPAEFLGQAKVVRINARAPYSSERRPSLAMCYPVFEYFDSRNVRRELAGVAAISGYFKIGDEVRIGKTNGRVVVMDSWFRSQNFIWSALFFSLLTAVSLYLLTQSSAKIR